MKRLTARERFKEWRETRGLSQRQVGDRMGSVDSGTVSKIERGTLIPGPTLKALIEKVTDIEAEAWPDTGALAARLKAVAANG